jgi:hypothetical protein
MGETLEAADRLHHHEPILVVIVLVSDMAVSRLVFNFPFC